LTRDSQQLNLVGTSGKNSKGSFKMMNNHNYCEKAMLASDLWKSS